MARWTARVGFVVLVVAIGWGLWLIPSSHHGAWPHTGHAAVDVLIILGVIVGGIVNILGALYALAWVFSWLWEKAR